MAKQHSGNWRLALSVLVLSCFVVALILVMMYWAWAFGLVLGGEAWNEGRKIRDLPNGLYVYESPGGVWICRDPAATLVAPSSFEVSIASMAVIPPYLLGRAEKRTGIPGPVGYFVLDMRTDELVEGMSETAWDAELAKRGLPVSPDLQVPPGE